MSLDFRKLSFVYPASVTDVNAGIRWLKQHAQALGGRPDWVGGLGSSSGGHLILLNALRPADPDYCDMAPDAVGHDARLRLVVACWPIVDPDARYRMTLERGMTKLTEAHDAYWVPPQGMVAGNPQNIVDEGRFTDLPPTLVIQGTDDGNMTPDMIPRFVEAYRGRGGRLDIETFEGQPHDFICADPSSATSARAMVRIRDFILSS
jgi:acetyl esterase